jgi:Flp pilus assembly protein TadG
MKQHRNERGAAAVEMAIVLPILILLVFGIIEFSIAFNHKQGLHAAAREGARFGALPQNSQDEIIARVEDALDGVADPDDVTITVTPNIAHPCDLQSPDARVKVTVSMPYQANVPLADLAPVTLTGSGEFRCE